MSFLAYTLPTVATVAGGAISAKGSKDAAKTAAAGGDAEIEFNRESRDLVRADQAPYRKAGYTALDALMSLTGLGGGGGGGAPGGLSDEYDERIPLAVRQEPRSGGGSYRSAYGNGEPRPHLRYAGGAMAPSTMYNINELGPENVYSGGAITRNPNPMTIDGRTGYVEPNIQGRVMGGDMGVLPPGREYGPPPAGYGAPPMLPPDVRIPGPHDDLGGGRTRTNGGPMPPTPIPQPQGGMWNNETPVSEVVGGYGGGNTANSTAINPQTGYPNENPGGVEGGYNFMTEPGYEFRFSEGQRALDRGAAARGGLLSGGYARKAIRYGQGFASNEYSNVYNRIANIAGLGQTANQAAGNATMYGGAAMGNAASNAANATAYGQIGAGNAWANAGNEIARLPWGQAIGAATGPFRNNYGTPNEF